MPRTFVGKAMVLDRDVLVGGVVNGIGFELRANFDGVSEVVLFSKLLK